MTDKEIIECAENCLSENPSCISCPFDEDTYTIDECMGKLVEKLIEVVNRQKANLDDKEETIQFADKEIKRLNAEVEESTAKISVRDKLLDIAETKINATEKNCQYLRKLYNEKVCLCEEQNAEINRLQAMVDAELDTIHNLGDDYERVLEEENELVKTAKTEAIKEFAERLKELSYLPNLSLTNMEVVDISEIDNLVKEMTE